MNATAKTKTSVIVEHIVSQHAEEAGFLWILRDIGVISPNQTLSEICNLENRIESHLDGLRVAGDDGWEAIKEQLGFDEPGEVFTAGVLALESGDRQRIDEVVEIAAKEPEIGRGFISAMGWVGMPLVDAHVKQLLQEESPVQKRLGIGASAVLRVDPGDKLSQAAEMDDMKLRSRAYKAAGELGRRDLLGLLQQGIESDDEACRFWAAWSSGLMQQSYGVETLQRIAEGKTVWSERAADLAARCLPREAALRWREKLLSDPVTMRMAVQAAGAIGDPALMPWIIEMMKIDEHARVAGEAFTMITGVDIAFEDLERDWPEGFEAGPTDDPEDENVEMDADENLPWPDPDLIGKWWSGNSRRFRIGTRYFLGKPMNPKGLREALRTGLQRQRSAAAIELMLQQHDRLLFEVRARGSHQKKLLGLSS